MVTKASIILSLSFIMCYTSLLFCLSFIFSFTVFSASGRSFIVLMSFCSDELRLTKVSKTVDNSIFAVQVDVGDKPFDFVIN